MVGRVARCDDIVVEAGLRAASLGGFEGADTFLLVHARKESYLNLGCGTLEGTQGRLLVVAAPFIDARAAHFADRRDEFEAVGVPEIGEQLHKIPGPELHAPGSAGSEEVMHCVGRGGIVNRSRQSEREHEDHYAERLKSLWNGQA